MKIFITGSKGIGKTSCIQNVIKKCHMKPCGFVTLPFYENGIRKGFYMHSYLDLDENDVLFSTQFKDYNKVINGVFEKFGVFVLEESLKTKNYVMILDEIGYLEKEEIKYIDTLLKCIETHPNILGVIKKDTQEYITKIKKMKDVIILNMDEMSAEEIEMIICKGWEIQNA